MLHKAAYRRQARPPCRGRDGQGRSARVLDGERGPRPARGVHRARRRCRAAPAAARAAPRARQPRRRGPPRARRADQRRRGRAPWRRLPENEHRAGLGAALRAGLCPRHDARRRLRALVAALIDGLGLVLLDPDDAALKRLGAPLFACAARGGGAADACSDAGAAPRGARLPRAAQPPPPPACSSWTRRGASRSKRTATATASGRPARHFTAEALAEAPRAPQRGRHAAPGVGGRAAAHGRLRGRAGRNRVLGAAPGRSTRRRACRCPSCIPRLSATLVDARTRRALARLGLAPEAVNGPADALFAAHASHDAALTAALDAAEALWRRRSTRWTPALGEVPASAREAAQVRALREVERLREKARRAERRRQGDLRAAAERAVTLLRPGGGRRSGRSRCCPLPRRTVRRSPRTCIDALPLGPAQAYVVDL